MITVFLVDDQPATRAVLRLRLELEAGFTVIGEAGNNDDTVAQVLACAPDVVILDVVGPMLDGSDATALLRGLVPGPAVVVLCLYDDPATRAHAIAAGARTVVSKHDPDGLVPAVIQAGAHPFPSPA